MFTALVSRLVSAWQEAGLPLARLEARLLDKVTHHPTTRTLVLALFCQEQQPDRADLSDLFTPGFCLQLSTAFLQSCESEGEMTEDLLRTKQTGETAELQLRRIVTNLIQRENKS